MFQEGVAGSLRFQAFVRLGSTFLFATVRETEAFQASAFGCSTLVQAYCSSGCRGGGLSHGFDPRHLQGLPTWYP